MRKWGEPYGVEGKEVTDKESVDVGNNDDPASDKELALWRELLVCQLKECWSDNRQFDGMLWQLPVALMAVAALTANVVIKPIVDDHTPVTVMHLIVSLLSFLFSCALVTALLRNRFFQKWRNRYRTELFEALIETASPKPSRSFFLPVVSDNRAKSVPGLVPFDGGTLARHQDKWWERLSAYRFLLIPSLLILLAEAALAIWMGCKLCSM